MNALSIVNEGAGLYIVDGDMTFPSMTKKTVTNFKFLTSGKNITIDLGGVGNADSAGLALMLEWVKVARSKRVQLHFRNLPTQIINLAKLSGLEVLPFLAEANINMTMASVPT